MSYSASAALQTALFGVLNAASSLSGAQVIDALPPGGGSGTFILIGPEEVTDRSDSTGRGAVHRFTLSVISTATGFLAAKQLAGAACDVLLSASPSLPAAAGRIVQITFEKAQARRLDDGSTRRIDMTFRARIEI